jgi:G3E family GTPase
MQTVRIILVGGFLGAGKTTLLWRAAERLAARGLAVGLITNDQAPDLVDTGLLALEGLPVREVAGSCFCCNFRGLLDAADALRRDVRADVLVAEPVGSCTDLSATILQPLKDRFAAEFVPAPLSVLADPARLAAVLDEAPGDLHPSAAYIVRKQLEEADVLVLNKVDALAAEARDDLVARARERFAGAEVRCLSARTGEGVDEWLDAVLAGRAAGRRILDVDYDTYAEGEAVLGWLNAAVRLESTGEAAADWRRVAVELLEGLRRTFGARGAAVGHVKLLLAAGEGRYVANLTRTDAPVEVQGEVPGAPAEAALVLNARVEMAPETLEGIVREALARAAGPGVAVMVRQLRSLSPGRPQPTHRYDRVVGEDAPPA